MSTARQKAKTRRTTALVLFAIGGASILLKLLGINELDTSTAASLNAARGMRAGYYFGPVIPLVIGYLFWSSSNDKLLEAEYEEKAAANSE